MKLGYFTFPIHPKNLSFYKSLKLDEKAIIHADKLNFNEAFIGEHVTDNYEKITSNMIFISNLIAKTKKIKLGTGTVNLPNTHPVTVASSISMLDHMSKGRIIFGIGPGSLVSDMEVYETLEKNRNEMFMESISHIKKLWTSSPPYDLQGKYWKISTKKTFDKKLSIGYIQKTLQKPYPEIVVTSLSANKDSLIGLCKQKWNLISSNFLHEHYLKIHGHILKKNKFKSQNWRMARMIFVNKNKRVIEDYVYSKKGPFYLMVDQIFNKLKKYKRLEVVRENPDENLNEITTEKLLRRLVICGDEIRVKDDIQKLKDTVGNFDTLTYVGEHWRSPKLSMKSMKLLSEKIIHKIK
jgi:hypothetical protein